MFYVRGRSADTNVLRPIKDCCIINRIVVIFVLSVFRFYQPGRDAKGAALALFTARLHRPDVTTHKAVLQAIIYQLDKAIERFDTTLPTL